MRTLAFTALMFAALAAHAADSFQDALRPAAPTHPALYSFADVYRLTVAGTPIAGPLMMSAADPAIRVAATQVAPAPELQFSVVSLPAPQPWLLLLSGLALATWVARRRLGYFF
jgi:hypothetical protein